MIPFRKRGMYQALQNGIVGFGAISGAAFGGSIADTIGWRWCFIAQVPVSLIALAFGFKVLRDPPGIVSSMNSGWDLVWKRVDFRGSVLLVTAISVQLLGLSLGGNELPWGSPWVIGLVVLSFVLFGLFLYVESTTTAMPIIPLHLFKGRLPLLIQTANVLAGLAVYAVSKAPSSLPPATTNMASTFSCCLSSSRLFYWNPPLKLVPASPFHP